MTGTHTAENYEKAAQLGVRLPSPEELMAQPCSECKFVHRGRCELQPIKAQIIDEIAGLEFEQFRHPGNEEDRLAVLTTRRLAIEQLQDDVDTTAGDRDRIGRAATGWVYPRDMEREEHDTFELWPDRTEDDDALQLAMEPFLDKLSPEERMLIRLHFDAGESQRKIGWRKGVSKQAIAKQLKKVYAKLYEMMTDELIGREEVEVIEE